MGGPTASMDRIQLSRSVPGARLIRQSEAEYAVAFSHTVDPSMGTGEATGKALGEAEIDGEELYEHTGSGDEMLVRLIPSAGEPSIVKKLLTQKSPGGWQLPYTTKAPPPHTLLLDIHE